MHWKIYTDAGSPEKAQGIVSAAIEKLSVATNDLKIERYHKGGFVCSFVSSSSSTSWPEVVLEAVKNAQTIGRNWLLTGDINNELDLWSNESSVIGIKSINLIVDANSQQND